MLKLFRFLKPYQRDVSLVLVLMFLQTIAQLYLPTLMADVVDIGVVGGDIPFIVRVGGIMLVVAAAGTACVIWSSFLSSRVASGYGKILRRKVFSHVENFSLHEFDQIGTASLITRTTNDITQIQQVMIMMLRMFISAPMMMIGGVIMAVSKDAKLSLVLVVAVPLLALAIILIARKAVPLFKALQNKLDKLNLVMREGLTGVRVIRAFNRIGHDNHRFQQANQDLTGTAIQVNQLMAYIMPIMMIALNFSMIAIMWFGSIRIDHGDLQVGDLMAFIQYAMQIMFSLIMVSMMFVMIPRASASATRINAVLEMEAGIADAPRIQPSGNVKGYIEYQDVTFSYAGAERPALQHISFSAKPGEVTAIIGGTGSGKSTMVHLLPRFYDVDSGRILVDGVDVRELAQEDLRAKIGFVPQKAVLFTGTVADNIRFGNPDAGEEEVRKAAEIAQAAPFIAEMADGYESVITQGGTNLSGGQKQRLAIARALVRRPEIYVFDDSFSALDFKTDARLREALKGEIAQATVLIIAQRVSTIMDADQIIVLEDGIVAGIGTHRALMDRCSVYREIVSSQLSEEESA